MIPTHYKVDEHVTVRGSGRLYIVKKITEENTTLSCIDVERVEVVQNGLVHALSFQDIILHKIYLTLRAGPHPGLHRL